MLRHSLGGAVIFNSLQHFIAPALDLMTCLPSRQRRKAISLQVLLENLHVVFLIDFDYANAGRNTQHLQVLLESDILLLAGKYKLFYILGGKSTC